jgi:BirA family biotin operon repressor/biotin-[acetyl-CoA-carboxylase] ligase
VLAEARGRSVTLGRPIRVELPGDQVLEGEAVALADDGSLVVRDRAGDERAVAVGDVVHVRPIG